MRSLRSRLTFWYTLVISGTLALVLMADYALLKRELVHGIDLLNAAEWSEIQEKLEHHPVSADALQEVILHSQIDARIYYFQIHDDTGQLLFRSQNLRHETLPFDAASPPNRTARLPQLGTLRIGLFHSGSLFIEIASSLKPTSQLLKTYTRVSLVMLVLVGALSIFLGRTLSRLALEPIQRIKNIADRIRADNLSERIPAPHGNDELAQLTRLLNQMFDRLEISFKQLQSFAGKASHELKTPLSVMRLQSEKLLLEGNLDPARQEALQQQLEGIIRLNSVIDKLLFLARAGVGVTPLQRQRTSFNGFINSFAEDALVLCEDQDVFFEICRNDVGTGFFDAALLHQVLLNLVANALNVSPKASHLRLFSETLAGCWRVSLEDDGPGLTPGEMTTVFEPFVRLCQHSTAEDGSGLGLAICRSIISLHQGRIWMENRTPGPGLRVVFELPVCET